MRPTYELPLAGSPTELHEDFRARTRSQRRLVQNRQIQASLNAFVSSPVSDHQHIIMPHSKSVEMAGTPTSWDDDAKPPVSRRKLISILDL